MENGCFATIFEIVEFGRGQIYHQAQFVRHAFWLCMKQFRTCIVTVLEPEKHLASVMCTTVCNLQECRKD